MSLKGRFGSASLSPRGLALARSPLETFTGEAAFRKALHTQAVSTVHIETHNLSNVDVQGRLYGVEDDRLRLTKNAFGQLCNLCKIPVRFVERMAQRNERLALDILVDAITGDLARDASKVLVVDTRTWLVEAILNRDDCTPIPNEDVLDLALSVGTRMQLNRAYIEGPDVRITVIDRAKVVKPKVDDVVCLGMDLRTSLGSDIFLVAQSYNERLKCTNGMTIRANEQVRRVSSREDLAFAVPEAIVKGLAYGETIEPMMRASTELFFDDRGIEKMIARLSDPKTGGGKKHRRDVVLAAQKEATDDARLDTDLCLWDFVNGVTHVAKSAPTLSRRLQIEGDAFLMMADVLQEHGAI